MELYWKTIGAVLTVLILGMQLSKQEQAFSVLLTIAVCCMGAAAAVSFLEPVLTLLRELEAVARLEEGILGILLKCTGIAVVTEMAALICRDGASGALGKMIQLLGSAVIAYLSIPVVTMLLGLVRGLLGDL